ncbi:carbohydrate binding domain-containing protein [Candidatus Sumerlaeota bacterium]|nr:carbohydrate binding domain-containing protein [Candidatus Sumerlaeota bacterium]
MARFRNARWMSVLLMMAMACAASLSHAAVTTSLPVPPRPAGAMTGSQFYNHILNMTDAQREQAIINEIVTGNIPDFLRALKPITVNTTINGTPHSTTYHVTCDYMAIGSDADFFRMPMSAPLAQQVADVLECALPTRKIVNDVYTNCAVKLAPHPFSPASYDIDSVPVFWLSQQAIEDQRQGYANGLLTGGTKKDVILSPTIPTRPSPARVCIYGWHQLNGSPIQPLSTIHEASYEDYSHGTRLIGGTILVDGVERTVAATLADSSVAALLSDEGAFSFKYPVPSPYPLPGAQNLVSNGSFENGFTGGVGNGWTSWTASGSNAITFGAASLNKVDGASSQYWKRGDTLAFDGGVRQVITVTPGATYRIKAQMKRQSTFTGTGMMFGYDLGGGTDGTAPSVVYTNLTGGTDNVWVSYDVTATATGSSLTIFARGGHSGTTGGANAYFYLDAISVTQTSGGPTPTPTPTATPSPSPSPTPTVSPSPSPTPAPTEQLTNGSFEGGFTSGVGNGWTKFQVTNTITFGQASVNKYDGSYSQYWSRNDTAAFDGGVYQVVSVNSGAAYSIVARMKRQSTLVGTSMRVGYDLTGGTNPAAASVVYTDITGATDNVWNTCTTNVTATGTSITIFLRAGHTGTTGGTNSYFYADAASMMGP